MSLGKINFTGDGITGPKTFKGKYLNFDGRSGLVFDGLTFEDSGQVRGHDAKFITFHKCTFRRLHKDNQVFVPMTYGNDDWIFDGCEFSECGNAIYPKYDTKGRAAMRLTVINCIGHDIGVGDWADKDGHFLGRQGGWGYKGKGDLIKGNRIRRTGSGIEYWGRADRMMSEIEITDNDISGCVKRKITEGCGIVISGSHNADEANEQSLPESSWLPTLGWRRNITIARNKIADCEFGISANIREPIAGLHTNEISNCRQGKMRIRNPFEVSQ